MKEKHPELNEEREGIQYTVTDGPLQLLNIAYPHDGLDEEEDIERELYGKRVLEEL